jgi:hypothetical protein
MEAAMEDHLRTEVGPVPSVQMASTPPPVEAARGGPEWGVASLTLGAVFAIMLPPALLLVHSLEATHYEGFSRTDKRFAALGGGFAALFILVLAGVGVASGFLDMAGATRRGRPIALGLTGVLLNAMDLFLWVATTLAWLSSILNVV